MKRSHCKTTVALVMLMCGLVSGVTGCNRDIAGDVVTLPGAYIGDVVTVLVTGCLCDALSIEEGDLADETTAGDEHSHAHAAEALHDHEH